MCASIQNYDRAIQGRVKCRAGGSRILIVLLVISLFFILFAGSTRAIARQMTSAASMITLECSTNRVLFQKNADQKRPMASTTKIVTAITVIELCDDIEAIVSVPKSAVGIEGSSIYLQCNERLSIKDLLYGLMLQSGNDCAVALATIISGSVEGFAKEMNSLAKRVGANNSNFVNPHGLHHDNHYTTARDLALISSYAMKNEVFSEIVKTKRYTTTWEGRDYDRIIINKNKILSNYHGGNGIKTGYTKRAGRCLVSAANKNNMQVISVVLNCGPMFEECSALMDRAFELYKMHNLVPPENVTVSIPTQKAKQPFVRASAKNEIMFPLRDGELERVKYEFETAIQLTAPINFEAEVGKVKVFLDNQLLFCEKLYTIEEADPLDVRDYLKTLISKWSQI